MKKIVKEEVNKLLEDGQFINNIRYKVMESNDAVFTSSPNWCQATYITPDFDTKDAIFDNLDDAIALCKGKIGILKHTTVMTFNDDGEEITLE